MNKQLELDCYHKAEEGEPKFTLLARDPLAPHMVALWAALRKGDTASAVVLFGDMVADPAYEYRNQLIKFGELPEAAKDKIASASAIAKEMNEWRAETGKPFYEIHTVR